MTESEELRAGLRRAMELLDLIRDIAGLRTWDPVVDTVEFSPTWTSASDRDQIVAAWRAAQSSEKAFSVQHKGPPDRGHHVTHARPYRNARGRVEGWVGVVVPNHEPAVDDLAPPAWAIRAARAALGWTTQELAERAGVSFSTIRRAETESQAASVRRASRSAIATALRRAGVRFPARDGQIAVSLLPSGETP